MNIKKERQRIVAELLNGTDREFTDEELMQELLDTSTLYSFVSQMDFLNVAGLMTRLVG